MKVLQISTGLLEHILEALESDLEATIDANSVTSGDLGEATDSAIAYIQRSQESISLIQSLLRGGMSKTVFKDATDALQIAIDVFLGGADEVDELLMKECHALANSCCEFLEYYNNIYRGRGIEN